MHGGAWQSATGSPEGGGGAAVAESCTEPRSDRRGHHAVLGRRRSRRIFQGDARRFQGWIHGREDIR
jgi:hypothetical protein